MATILESEAAFNARAIEHGITRAQQQRLQNHSIVNLSKLAFSITTPGTTPPDDALKQLLADDPDTVTVGELSSMRRLMFDAQTLSASQIKSVLGGTESSKKAELVPAERATSIQNQKTRLQGFELTGPLEASHSSYDYVAKMMEQDTPMYLEPHRFTTRASEVARERPGKELVLDNVNLTVQDVERKDKCQISNELELHQAFTRRSLACDLMQVCTFRTMEKWHRTLIDQMQSPAPPGFRRPTMEQILRADRAAWVKMAEKVTTLKRKADGTLPLNTALEELHTDPSVMFHLMPLPLDRATVQGRAHQEPKMSDDAPRAQPRPKNKFGKPSKGTGKGKGKTKSKPTSKGRMPTELIGLHQQTKAGKRMCYNFNLAKGCDLAAPGQECVKGEGLPQSAPPDAGSLKTGEPGRGTKRNFVDHDEFLQLFSERVKGIAISDLIFIEIFSGTAGLTAEARVDTANILYQLSGQIMTYATQHGILCTLENPARSHMWNTSFLVDQLRPIQNQLYEILFHHCAYGSQRKKRTKLLVNHERFRHLSRDCDESHEHLPWGHTPQGWATAMEVEYPVGLCREWASCLREILLTHGATDVPASLQPGGVSNLNLQARAALGVQPRGKRLKPLMKEFAYIIKVFGPKPLLSTLPLETKQHTHVLPPQCHSDPPCFVLPAHSKQLRTPVLQGGEAGQQQTEADQIWKVEYGIAWDPQTFVACAAGLSHPGHCLDGVHSVLATFFQMSSCTPHSIALERTEAMRKSVTRFQELKESGVDGLSESPAHAREILKSKNLQLLDEMVRASGSPDVNIAADIARGFDLMGPIPSGGIFPCKPLYATLLPEQVREMASLAREATWSSVKRNRDPKMCQDIYNSVIEECQKGWMRGPFTLAELPEGAVLTRRFGVQQTSTLADGSRVSESLINVTNSCDETIMPMGIDQICAALVKRMRLRSRESLVCKTIDLRKAYKNLPLSEPALKDSYICVLSPSTGVPEAFQTLVLPFGARAAVMGFCRASYSVWRIGVILFNLHWTVYFDDYFLVAEVQESKQDAHLGSVTVCNVESRVKELTAMIDDIVARGKIDAATMRTLRGRMVFAEAQFFGRLTGIHMKRLSNLENIVGEADVDGELLRSLLFLRNRVIAGGPRRVLSEVGRVFHLYTDACFEDGSAGIGGVLIDDHGNVLSFFSEQISSEVVALLNPLRKRGLIFELEALAVMVGATQLLNPIVLRPCDRVVVFIDNEAVLARVVTGRGNLQLDQTIFQMILEWEFVASAVMWYERVPSHANVADAPSRNVLDGLDVRLRINVDPAATIREAAMACAPTSSCLAMVIALSEIMNHHDLHLPAAAHNMRLRLRKDAELCQRLQGMVRELEDNFQNSVVLPRQVYRMLRHQLREAVDLELLFLTSATTRQVPVPLSERRCEDLKWWFEVHEARIQRLIDIYRPLGYPNIQLLVRPGERNFVELVDCLIGKEGFMLAVDYGATFEA
eukprot:s2284_g6.t1